MNTLKSIEETLQFSKTLAQHYADLVQVAEVPFWVIEMYKNAETYYHNLYEKTQLQYQAMYN